MGIMRMLAIVLLFPLSPAVWEAEAGETKRSAASALASRFCTLSDLVGTWRLVRFETRYQFKDPNAPYLLPHQVFQFAKNGDMKSASSSKPFERDSFKVLQSMPAQVTYGMKRNGMVVLKAKGAPDATESWHCVAMTQDRTDEVHETVLRRGDLVMTLIGPNGQPVLVRQLRKGTH